ncbi:MAG: alpha/beta hydrolase [Lachnospiraceae bacterium]|nr:alpha/beta hydrolase [Lachnospiraceae bacterium]
MGLRMWRTNGVSVSFEGKKGYFDVVYGNDSESQKLDVWLPEGEGPFPAIISIHGGGFIACDKRQGDMITPMLAGLNRGIAVIGLNYRLSTEAHFPDPVKDIKQAIRFIKAHADKWNIDSDKLVTWGGSAGAYYTLMSCLFTDDTEFDNQEDPNVNISAKLAGGIAWYPVTDFPTLDAELRVNSVINKFCRKEIIDKNDEYEPAFPQMEDGEFPFHDDPNSVDAMFVGDSTVSERAKHVSPIYKIHKDMLPIFVQHGSCDEILPMEQSVRFMLKANDVCGEERVKLEIIPNAIHSSVLFETKENIDKCLDFIEDITSK